jgi:hypothetical protein
VAERPTDLTLIELAIDAARVVDDFVRSVVELAGGELGGGRDVHRSWTQRKLGSWLYGERQLARGFAARHDREQLMKAAAAADELVLAIRTLDTGGAAAADARAAAIDLDVEAIPTALRQPDARASSPQLREAHARLARVIAALNEARTRALLEAMRSERPPGP